MSSIRLHHVNFTAAGVLLLVALIPPFDWLSVGCLIFAGLNLAVGQWLRSR